MRRTPSERDRRRHRSGWLGRVLRRHGAAAPALALAFLGAQAAPAWAQAPGPESFATEPKTALELWDAVDYLVRVGQAGQAVPYLKKFLDSKPDDATLLAIRDRYGAGSILRLAEFPETRDTARPLLERLTAASRRGATQPARLGEAVAGLAASRAEQRDALDRLREAGPYAVPPLVAALNDGGRSREDRALIAANAGRLDRTTVPAWIAALAAPESTLAADAAEILGRIGDARAVPALTYYGARRVDGPLRVAARAAVARLTGRPFEAQPRTPVRVLADEARRYLVHAVTFPGDAVEVWDWASDAPTPRTASKGDAEASLGLRYARQALDLDPADAAAQAAFVGLALQEGAGRAPGRFPADDPTHAWPAALAAGPAVLGNVLRQAIADGQSDLAATAATALGQVIDRNSLAAGRRPSPLVEAVTAPDRRVQFAAARALVELDPARPFPGSDRVVPALSRFVAPNPAVPKAVVIDGNVNRGNRVANLLRELGYDGSAVGSGEEGFRQAAGTADVEAVFLEPSGLQGPWKTIDTLTNLRADPRTAGLPIFLLQPEDPTFDQAYVDRGFAAPTAEREPNDTPATGNPLAIPPDTHRVRVAGALPKGDAQGDYYRLGPLKPGATVVAGLTLPPAGTLKAGDAILTLEREVLLNRPGDTRSFPVAEAQAGRLAYLIPAAPEPPPKDEAADTRRQLARETAKARGRPLVENAEVRGYGGYLIHVRPPNPTALAFAADRGPFPAYFVDVATIARNPSAAVPAAVRERLEDLAARFPRVAVVVPSTDPTLWRRQLGAAMTRMGARPLSEAERTAYAGTASALLARVAARPNGPFGPDLDQAGPALTAALNSPTAGLAAAAALGDVPGVAAQRGLADAAIDPSRPADVRRQAAGSLARSLRRFGMLLAGDQPARLTDALNREADPAVRAALASAVGSLHPRPAAVGRRLPASLIAPAPAAAPAAAAAAPNPPGATP